MALKEYFDWLENESSYRNKLEIEFVCKDMNTNKSLVKMCKTYYLMRSTWKARVADLARKGHRGTELRREKLLIIQRLLTANHKADDKIMVTQRNIIVTALETLKPRYTAGFEMWCVMVMKMWKEEEYQDVREWVKAEQSRIIKETGMNTEIRDAKKYKKPQSNAGSTGDETAS